MANESKKTKLSELIAKQLDHKDPAPLNPFEIRNYIYYGFSDDELRPLYWRMLLNYYTENKFKTEMYFKKCRRSYHEILSSISKDTAAYNEAFTIVSSEMNRMPIFSDKENSLFLNYREPIERILIAYTLTNKSIGYVQGMNFLILPIYHVMQSSKLIEISKFAEEDTFYLFNNLMVEMNDIFTKQLDHSEHGISTKINNVFNIIKMKDPELFEILRAKKLLETMFPLKWLMLLFSSEFNLDSTIVLWDRILSDSYRFEILEYCCAAATILLRNILIKENFENCMKVLQNPSIIEPGLMFDIADTLRREKTDILSILKNEKISDPIKKTI